MKKPVKPVVHGVIDYVFSGVLLAAPTLLRMNSTAKRTFGGLGASMLALDAMTNTPAGIMRKVPFQTHKKVDLSMLAGMTLLPLIKPLRRDKTARIFGLAVLALAVTHHLLTDYSSNSK